MSTDQMNNLFSSVHIDATGTLDGVLTGIAEVQQSGPSSMLLLIAESSDINLVDLPQLFSKQQVPVRGVVVPRLIVEGQLLQKGVLICGFKPVVVTRICKQIDRPEEALYVELQSLLHGVTDMLSALLIIDGTSSSIDGFIHCVHDLLGPDITVVGCGVGYADFVHRPSIITADGLLQNAALLSFIPTPLGVGVSHGWKKLAGPFLVTHAEGNLVHSINYQPALGFYQDIVEQHAGQLISQDDFYRQSTHFPFGMEQFDDEFLVRDPTTNIGSSIEFAGGMPSNTMVYILHGDKDALCEAAGSAAKRLSEKISPSYESEETLHVMVIDCVSRWVVLGDEFVQELNEIRSQLPDKAKMIGLLSLGELASSTQGLLQLLNKTTVVVGLGK